MSIAVCSSISSTAMTGYRLKGIVTDIDGVLDFVEDTCIASRKVVASNLRECGEFYAARLV